ncbi:MAG TPA: DUF2442 domain-containing protein [Thermoflexales bacterium]|nr:DUF2442 domain-containing protein [Thermoflexales bacterium]
MKTIGPLVKVTSVKALRPFNVLIGFRDGIFKEIDLEPFLQGPVFEPIRRDPAIFRSVRVMGSTIGWYGDVDIDPDVLYYDLTPARNPRR